MKHLTYKHEEDTFVDEDSHIRVTRSKVQGGAYTIKIDVEGESVRDLAGEYHDPDDDPIEPIRTVTGEFYIQGLNTALVLDRVRILEGALGQIVKLITDDMSGLEENYDE